MAKSKSDIEVKTFIANIEDLIANENNPRKINQKQFQALKKSLQEFPEMKQLREIVVDENMQILGGHQRIYALQDLGYAEVTVKQVIGFTEAQKREFTIKDNTNAGDWNTDILANHFDIEELENWGVPSFSLGIDNDGDSDKGGKDPKLVECPECGHEFEA